MGRHRTSCGPKNALHGINPNIVADYFNLKVAPVPTLLNSDLDRAYANTNDDDHSLDDNSEAGDVEDRISDDGGLSGLSTWKVFDQGTCRAMFVSKDTSYICGGVYKKCNRSGHNSTHEDERHPPVAARQVKIRANSKQTDGDANTTTSIERYIEECKAQAATCTLQRQTAMQSPGFTAGMDWMNQGTNNASAGKTKPNTLSVDDEDDAASFQSLKQQATNMDHTLEQATRAALATPTSQHTSNARPDHESTPDPIRYQHEFRQFLAEQQQTHQRMQLAWQKQVEERQQKMQLDAQRQMAEQMQSVQRSMLQMMKSQVDDGAKPQPSALPPPQSELELLRSQVALMGAQLAATPPTPPQPLTEVEVLKAQVARMGVQLAAQEEAAKGPPPLPVTPVAQIPGWQVEMAQLKAELEEHGLNDTTNFPTGPDFSNHDEEMFGISTNNPKAILNALIPPNCSEDLKTVLTELIPDVTASATGEFRSEQMSDESNLVALLGRAMPGVGSHLRAGDNCWHIRKDMLHNLKTRKELDSYAKQLATYTRKRLPVFHQGLTQALQSHHRGAGYAKSFTLSSRFSLWVTSFFDMWQHLIRHFIETANIQGYEATDKEIVHHREELDMIRSTSTDRFHMLVQIYTYLRHANYRQYYSEPVANLRLEYQLQGVRDMAAENESKKSPAAGAAPPATPANTGKCPWCASTKHSGGKARCPFAGRSISHQASVMLAARVEQRGGAFAGTATTVIKEYFAEKEKEKEREKEKEKEKKSEAE